MRQMQYSTFFAKILNPSFEMIVYKNRYGNKGKIQLNFEKDSLFSLLNYREKKFNLVVGNTKGYKSVVFNSIIKEHLDKGKKICFLGYIEDITRLFLDLSERNYNVLNANVIGELKERYPNQLFFENNFEKIDKDMIVFSELDVLDSRYSLIKDLPNKEIWQTVNKNRTGDFSYSNALSELGDKNVSFIHIKESGNKIILESKNNAKGFFIKNGLITLNIFVNLSNYINLLNLELEIQDLDKQISFLTKISENNALINLKKIKESKLKIKHDIIKEDIKNE